MLARYLPTVRIPLHQPTTNLPRLICLCFADALEPGAPHAALLMRRTATATVLHDVARAPHLTLQH